MAKMPDVRPDPFLTVLSGSSGWTREDSKMVHDNQETVIRYEMTSVEYSWNVPAVANNWERVAERLELIKFKEPRPPMPWWVDWHYPVPACPEWYGRLTFQGVPTQALIDKITARIVKAVRWNWKG